MKHKKGASDGASFLLRYTHQSTEGVAAGPSRAALSHID